MSIQDQLRQLGLMDQQIRGLRSRLDAANNRTASQQNRREQLQRQDAELTDQLRRFQVKASSLENEAGDREQRITELREQMTTVTNNKQYSALLVEINTIKLDKSNLEDQALEKMTEVDQVKHQITEVEGKSEEQNRILSLAKSEAQSARDEVGTKLDELTAQRDASAKTVPRDVLTQFNRLAANYNGEAVASVEEQDRRRMEYICSGCYMKLPVEHINSLMIRPDDIRNCPHCGRILYINQELKSSIVSK